MDRRDQRSLRERLERERQPVEVVVDDVELVGALERMGDVECFPDSAVDGRVLRVAGGADAVELRRRLRVEGREERHVDAARVEPGGDQPGDTLPRPVVTRRCPPRDRAENRDFQLTVVALSTASSTSSNFAVARQIEVSAAP